jgi:hypothetical protein
LTPPGCERIVAIVTQARHRQIGMSWETQIAKRIFPKEQPFMAKRRLRYLLWAAAVGVVASAIFLGMALIAHNQR